MIDKRIVEEIVEAFFKSSDNYLVSIEIKPDNTILVEIDNDKAVSIDDCVALSSYIESKLDREKEDFALEVGSSGIGQTFKVRRQYRKYIGKEIEVLLYSGIKHIGILKTVDEDKIILTVETQIKSKDLKRNMPEVIKRKITMEEDLIFLYNDIKFAKYKL